MTPVRNRLIPRRFGHAANGTEVIEPIASVVQMSVRPHRPLQRLYPFVYRLSRRVRSVAKVFLPSADQVGKLTVFNIGGNKVRLIAALHYNRRQAYIRAVLTHEEYDEGKWKE